MTSKLRAEIEREAFRVGRMGALATLAARGAETTEAGPDGLMIDVRGAFEAVAELILDARIRLHELAEGATDS